MAGTRVPDSLDRLTDDRLMDLWTTVGQEAQERRDACRRLGAEFERRNLLAAAGAKLAALSEPERAALAQVAQAQGIESAEEVGRG